MRRTARSSPLHVPENLRIELFREELGVGELATQQLDSTRLAELATSLATHGRQSALRDEQTPPWRFEHIL